MMKIRFYIALWIGKAAMLAMKILGRNATYLPGKLAVKLCPGFMGYLRLPKTVIAVTGTNGKTTVSNMLTSILRFNGYTVTNNSLGSNIQAGVASALMEDSNWLGKSKKNFAVLEVDERSSLLIYPYIKPDYLICNNIMRDSNKRNAHTEFISYIINRAVPTSTHLVLNGDDLICSTLAPENEKRTYFGVEANAPQETQPPFICDIAYCPKCNTRLKYDYLRYNHIGRMYCPNCGLGVPRRDFVVTDVDCVKNLLTVSHDGVSENYHLVNDNIINVYNLCGVIALLTQVGLTYEQIANGIQNSQIVKTRYDQVTAGDLNITMQLSKGQNPIACTRAFHYAASCAGSNKALIILVDDQGENINDSENICWLYDCDYSFLADPSIGQVIFAGPRCKDHYLRALLSGVDANRIKLTPDFTGGPDLVDYASAKDIYVLYDLHAVDKAQIVKKHLIEIGNGGNGE